MRACFITFIIVFQTALLSQIKNNDSLQGFPTGSAIIEAHLLGLEAAEAKWYVEQLQRSYLNEKYNTGSRQSSSTLKKTNPNTVASAPCVDEDFEGLALGNLVSTAWVAQSSTNSPTTNVYCSTTTAQYTNNNTHALIVATPVIDAKCKNVPQSPLGGNKILQLNRLTTVAAPNRVLQTFSVTGTNFIYQYTYKGVLNGITHSCCEQSFILFRFYDCNNNPVIPLENKINFGTGCTTANDSSFWKSELTGHVYTPAWVLHTIDLSAYIGSCITVEIQAARCSYGYHEGYVYYDALCSNSITVPADVLHVNNEIAGASYSICAQTATLSTIGGFGSHLWQGPVFSGINNSTLSSITASVSGIYSLTATTGTLSFLKTVSLTLLAPPVLAVSGNSLLCAGDTAFLNVNGNAITYTWNTGAVTTSISAVSPTASTVVYSVSGTGSSGCIITKTYAVTWQGPPQITISPSAVNLCPGDAVTLTGTSTSSLSYFWDNGAIVNSISVSPTVNTVYTLTSVSDLGCIGNRTVQVLLKESPSFIFTVTPSSICAGKTVTFTVNNPNVWFKWVHNNVNFVNGFTLTPAQTATYGVRGTIANGCGKTSTLSLVVNKVPQVTISPSKKVCIGQPFLIQAKGTNIDTYLWNHGTRTVSAFQVTLKYPYLFAITVTAVGGCTAQSNYSIVPLEPNGQLQTFASDSIVCEGDPVILSATGTNIKSYLWSTGQKTASVTVYPNAQTTYSLLAIDTRGCEVKGFETILVYYCQGWDELQSQKSSLIIYPNPSGDRITVQCDSETTGNIYDHLGRHIRSVHLTIENNYSQELGGLTPSAYILKSDRGFVKFVIIR